MIERKDRQHPVKGGRKNYRITAILLSIELIKKRNSLLLNSDGGDDLTPSAQSGSKLSLDISMHY